MSDLIKRVTIAALMLCGVLLFTGCASVPGEPDPRDPWEGYNRAMFKFNDSLDRALLKPAAKGYQVIMPEFLDTTVSNFFSNLDDIRVAINNLLQFKINDGFSDLGRLLINSSFGLGGLLDISSEMGFPKHNEDFGQTLGAWGVPSGPYLIIPFTGPSTVRDTPASFADSYMLPINYLNDYETYLGLTALSIINSRADLLRLEKIADDVAYDRYTFIRNAYLDRRQFLVNDGRPSEDDNDLLNELNELEALESQ